MARNYLPELTIPFAGIFLVRFRCSQWRSKGGTFWGAALCW